MIEYINIEQVIALKEVLNYPGNIYFTYTSLNGDKVAPGIVNKLEHKSSTYHRVCEICTSINGRYAEKKEDCEDDHGAANFTFWINP